MTNTTQGVILHGVYFYSCQTVRGLLADLEIGLCCSYLYTQFGQNPLVGQFDSLTGKNGGVGKTQNCSTARPAGLRPAAALEPDPLPPPAGPKDQKRRGQAGFIARLRRAIYRFAS